MLERTEPSPDQPTPAVPPRPHPFADQPATVADCAADFGSGASVRAVIAKQDARRAARR